MTLNPYLIPIVIPAYEPDDKLIGLIRALRDADFKNIIVVDDGSSDECKSIFDIISSEYACTIMHHHVNQGKGRALKTAFNYCCHELFEYGGCITADADGQHSPECIKSIAEAMADNPDKLILGVRSFDGDGIPKKSELGNRITRRVMRLLTGVAVSDTQTGLRGIPASFMKKLLSVKGERYDFETNMLLETRNEHMDIVEIPIKTIYIDDNKSSHFNPFFDSVRIYMLFGKFIFSSLSASMIDMAVFILLCHVLRDGGITLFKGVSYIMVATVGARLISGAFNYTMNLRVVFQSEKSFLNTFPKYVALALVQMLLSAFLVEHIHALAGGLEIFIKIPVDLCLFFVSYLVQREVVYK